MVCEPRGVESLSMQAVTAAIRHPSSTMSPECTKMPSSTHSAGFDPEEISPASFHAVTSSYLQPTMEADPWAGLAAGATKLLWGWEQSSQAQEGPTHLRGTHAASLAEIHLGKPRGAGNSAALSQPREGPSTWVCCSVTFSAFLCSPSPSLRLS